MNLHPTGRRVPAPPPSGGQEEHTAKTRQASPSATPVADTSLGRSHRSAQPPLTNLGDGDETRKSRDVTVKEEHPVSDPTDRRARELPSTEPQGGDAAAPPEGATVGVRVADVRPGDSGHGHRRAPVERTKPCGVHMRDWLYRVPITDNVPPETVADGPGWKIPMLSLATVLFGVWLYSRLADFLAAMEAAPPWLRAVGWLLVGGLAVAVAGVAVRGWRWYGPLAKLPRMRVKADSMGQPNGNQCDQVQRRMTADYLPLLAKVMSEPRYTRLADEATRGKIRDGMAVLEERGYLSRAWCEAYVRKVQRPLEKLAMVRVTVAAKRVAIKTALLPWPAADMLVVVYWSTRMLQEISLIFGRRLRQYEALGLCFALMFQVYVAGETQEIVGGVVDLGGAGGSEAGVEGGVGLLSRLVGDLTPLAKGLVSRAAEGGVNYLLMMNVGRRYIKKLKPLDMS